MNNLYHLIYISQSNVTISDLRLNKLGQQARFNNSIFGVTGILLYDKEHFIQILEGTVDSVEKIFEKITRDSRHQNIQIAERKMIPHRAFQNWNMGYCHISNHAHLIENLSKQIKHFGEYIPLTHYQCIQVINKFSSEDFRRFIS